VFVVECGGDRERAVALYHWSAALTGALHAELGYFEIAFRNRLNDALTSAHGRLRARPRGAAWFDGPHWVRHRWWDHAAQAAINDARRRAQHHPPRSPRPDAVVAELGFGFWRYLVSARYEQSLWVPILDDAFDSIPGRTPAARREFIDGRLRVLHRLRNRVAHHELLIKPAVLLGRHGTPLSFSLDEQVAMIGEVLASIEPTAASCLNNSAASATPLAACLCVH
jgi:hypothetical protein